MPKDSYKYFRVEARELIEALAQGALQLEKGSFSPDVIARLLRYAHTLKGAARVVKQARIAEHAHHIEDLLATQREAAAPPTAEETKSLLGLVDAITHDLRKLDPESPVEPAQAPSIAVEEPFETVRVEIEEMDALLRDVTEAGVHLGAVRRSIGALERIGDLAQLLQDQLEGQPGEQGALPAPSVLRARSLAEELRASLDRFQRSVVSDVERVDGELNEARGVAYRLRLVPARTVFPALNRAVHDAALSLQRRVVFETADSDVRLDASVLSALRDALLHAVRNAVTHGIEGEKERVSAGKSPVGKVRLEVERAGSSVVFRCRDDGRGVDVEAVREAAIARGLVTAAAGAALQVEEVVRLAFAGGLSTRRDITELAGRGIGLDVVRETASRLKGHVSLRSEPGRGTVVEISVPVSLAAFPGLLVECAGTRAAIPLEAVRETLRVRDADIARSAVGDSILHGGEVIRFRALDATFRRRPAVAHRRPVWSAVVVRVGDLSAAIGVDRVIGTANIVMKSLASYVEADRTVAGVSLDSEGNPQLVLDAAGLVESARAEDARSRSAPPPPRPPILVVDDSLTTRMLEKSILESAGYEVEVASSAEEALEKTRDRRYCLFIVDVEMPGMDGFTFVTRTRADPVLGEIPAILVTSRNEPEDRRRGAAAGARAYIVKSEFDQGHLLQTIRTLVG